MPSGIAAAIAAVSETSVSVRCSIVRCRSRAASPSEFLWAKNAKAGLNEIRRHFGFTPAIEPHRRVHGNHGMDVDLPFETKDRLQRLRRTLLKIGAIKQDGIIGRKIVAVVVEHPNAVRSDFRVGGVEINNIDLSIRERPIGHVVVETGGRHLWQGIGDTECWPAVCTVEEFVAQAKPECR